MAYHVINRSELVGKRNAKFSLVEQIARSNSLNRTGKIDYNAGGCKDGIGLKRVTDKFVDNFLLQVLVPEYNTKGGRNIYIGSQNKSIRDLLDAYGLQKCIVKAVAFTRLKSVPSQEMLDQMPGRHLNKTASNYFHQEYKIACPNLEYSKVMDFIRTADYKSIGMTVKDIDVTMDYAGSFDKEEIIDHLVGNEGFREQLVEKEDPRTIVDNDVRVGRNCLTFMETIDGIATRQKIYNKMVQMLECKSVRESIGCHWKDWVCQHGTRLADARDKSSNRGLSRAEVTFYIKNDTIPTDQFIEETLQNITNYIPTSLVYSTPFSNIWSSYCDIFCHSLVCIDRSEDVGLIVYSYNDITGNISGHCVEKWSERFLE